LEVVDATFDIVAYMVAVFFGGEPRDSEFAAVDAQPRNVHGFRRCGICDLNDLLKVFVGLRLARARVSLKKVLVKDCRKSHLKLDLTEWALIYCAQSTAIRRSNFQPVSDVRWLACHLKLPSFWQLQL
jgi:hypothetical protein